MTTASSIQPISIVPGVMPSTDATPTDIPCWASAYHMRFDPTTGRLRKLGGWKKNTFDMSATITGTMRTIFSATINGLVYTILGTNSELYSLIGSQLVNITPLDASAVTAANSLATHYATLGGNPIATVISSNVITVTDPDYALYQIGDVYTLSGATTTNGILNTALNTAHVIRMIGTGTVSFYVASNATSTGSGGGASVVRKDGLIKLTSAAHGLLNGQRIKVDGAATSGGITDIQINLEFIIRNVTTNTFQFMTAGTATSAVTAAGGGGTEYYPQIAAGNLNQGVGQGYGAGEYGVGLYGTALVSTAGETYPRIWFVDRYGDNLVMTAGNQTGVYTWDGNPDVAPTLITNAPTDINYAFVLSNILVTFGHGVENEIFASDQGDITNWTASSSNQVFQDVVQGAGALISHVPIDGGALFFSENQTYNFTYLGLPLIWQIDTLDPTIGIIAPMARVSVNGYAYWMGQSNFYQYRGGKVEVIPSNLGGQTVPQSSILRYVFDNLNNNQRFKIFAWHNEEWDEIWWHYPSANSNECDRIARYSRKLGVWIPDMLNRTAGEYPNITLDIPRLANMSDLYTHENGNNDDTSPMVWNATLNKTLTGGKTAIMSQIIPDSSMTGTIQAEIRTYLYPQSAVAMNDNTYSINGTTEKVPIQLNGRVWNATISGSDLDQTFLMGQWYMEPQAGARAP